LDKTVPIGDTGQRLLIAHFLPSLSRQEENGRPDDPVVGFEVIGRDGKPARHVVRARHNGEFYGMQSGQRIAPGAGGPLVWYHPPDYRYGRSGVRGVLQFAQGEDGKLYYRSFNSSQAGGFNLETSGEVRSGGGQPVWGGMAWRFRVLDHLPHAALKERFVPVQVKPGKDQPGSNLPGAILCRLSVDRGKTAEEFWLGQQLNFKPSPRIITVGGQHFAVAYNMRTRDLDFDVKLERAEDTKDPGTLQSATFSSYIQLYDKARGIDGERRVITMNEPLDHAGYTFYQSTYEYIGPDQNGKPVNRSGFTVGRDPGLWMKYLGACMLALGIACMFYMKAYFYKPRGRTAAAPVAAPELS
jgi:hypothetical protein